MSELKFQDPNVTAAGDVRARVAFAGYKTIWFNTGTLCNLTCKNCYIESSPTNDRLVYISHSDVTAVLDEAERLGERLEEIGFTGGEPFMNPEFMDILAACLARGYPVLVLTNAMRPMHHLKPRLIELSKLYQGQLGIRVSLDHFEQAGHEDLRGARSWQPTIDGLIWLAANGFRVSVAGRTVWGKSDADMRAGYARLFQSLNLGIDAHNPAKLVLFPEMDEQANVPEISEGCWSKLHIKPTDLMCANSRMVVRRKDSQRVSVVACTLLPYDPAFDLGSTLESARISISLNHRHCARFCVLGGASCSAAK